MPKKVIKKDGEIEPFIKEKIIVSVRCLENTETSKEMLANYRTYYNFFRPHQALAGKTPSEEVGVTIDGNNKRLTLMRKSIQYQNAKTE